MSPEHRRTPLNDAHLLGPDRAPTPFTADEIRAGCRDGHRLLVREDDSGETSFHVARFDDGDAEGCTSTSVATDSAGNPTGAPQRARTTWRELQAHAAFPADATSIARERIRRAASVRSHRPTAPRGARG
ncbi:hypothetical protein [Agrococcus sp. Ld7]|uniref:hypothetical protein n=1 Tax=Agrococcus sp. Ld7 TaxID=649148 RepID=UPI003867B920